MLPGFNHNIKYKGRVYHIQTEDNGLDHPYIVSHIFLGGNILSTKKISYMDIALNENAGQIITEMMKEQHKTMVKMLIKGELDEQLENYDKPKVQAKPDVTAEEVEEWESEKSLDELILEKLNKKEE